MTASLALQYAIVALIVAASAWVAAKKLFPASVRRLRIVLAMPLLRESRPGWIRVLGRRIAPPVSSAGGCGGCAGCDSGTKR